MLSSSCRSRAISPFSLPDHGPMAASTRAAVAKPSNTTRRIMGKPRPGFCVLGCGYSAWFSGVSGPDAVVVAGLLDVSLGEQVGQRGGFVLTEGAKDTAEGGPDLAGGIRRKQRGLP